MAQSYKQNDQSQNDSLKDVNFEIFNLVTPQPPIISMILTLTEQ